MKNLVILAFMLMGTVVFGANTNYPDNPICPENPSEKLNEQGTLKIVMSDETVILHYSGNPDFQCCGEVITIDAGTSKKWWSFPVYGNGGYLFNISGNTTDMGVIINFLENIFDIIITP